MRYLLQDVDSNAIQFLNAFPSDISEACAHSVQDEHGFRDSYRRVVSLQAWRVRFLTNLLSDGVHALFLEAQNDALFAVVLAHMAMWRPALQSLRSCIETVLNTCYYADHPIEFQRWESGGHKNEFSKLLDYFSKHPAFCGQSGLPDVLAHIRREYATLSKAVHASSVSFHMTSGGSITITDSDGMKHSQWVSRHSSTLLWLNFLLIVLYSEALSGPSNIDLRRSVSLAVPSTYHDDVASNLNVHLFSIQ